MNLLSVCHQKDLLSALPTVVFEQEVRPLFDHTLTILDPNHVHEVSIPNHA